MKNMKIEMPDKKTIIKVLPNIIGGSAAIIMGFVFFLENNAVFTALLIGGISIIILPFMLTRYSEYNRKKGIEDNFPTFLADFVEAVRGGLTIPAAFTLISKNNYGKLTPFIKKIAAQLEWGITVERALISFSKTAKSPLISRIISSVIESHRYGGRLVDTFEALNKTAVEVEKLRAERRFFLQSQMTTGYIIFFVFLGVLISLESFLIPSLTQNAPGALSQGAGTPENVADSFKDIFRNLILIQGLFAGLAVGKMAEGAMIAGVKHSIIMMSVGGLVFFLFG